MTFPLINRVYEYKGDKLVVWAQDIFINVYTRTICKEDRREEWAKINWFKFAFKAKKLKNTHI